MKPFSAFVIIYGHPNRDLQIFEHLASIQEIRFTHQIMGPGSFICFAVTESIDAFCDLLDNSIRSCKFIASTDTRAVIMSPGLNHPIFESTLGDLRSKDSWASWVFLRTSYADPHRMLMSVRRIIGVSSAHALVGSDDGIALAKANGREDFIRIKRSIQGVPGVARSEFRVIIQGRHQK